MCRGRGYSNRPAWAASGTVGLSYAFPIDLRRLSRCPPRQFWRTPAAVGSIWAWSGSHQNSTLTCSVLRIQNVAVNRASVAEDPGGPSVGCTGQGSKGPSENRMGNRAGQRAQSDREDGTPSSPRGGWRQGPTLQRGFTRPAIRASRSIFI